MCALPPPGSATPTTPSAGAPIPTGPPSTAYLRITTAHPGLGLAREVLGVLVVIDGWDMGRQPYGSAIVPVAPGRHHVRIAARMPLGTVGDSQVVVDVPEGRTVGISWRLPRFIRFHGRLVVEGVVG